MMKLTIIIFITLVLSSCSINPSGNGGGSTENTNTDFTNLVWSDEFNQADGSAPSSANWTYDTDAGGWGNGERENYTSSINNSFISNNMLIIKAIYTGPSLASGNFTSARLKTQGKQFWQYGKTEARIALPYGDGIWPAFWMLGTSISSVGWPKCGEIDILEMIGGTNGAAKGGGDNEIFGTIHWDNGGVQSSGSSTSITIGTNFHVYSVIWNSSTIKIGVDGTYYYSGNITPSVMDEFRAPFFIILNIAVGGGWPGNPDISTVFPQYMYVDWVRVYQ